MTAIAPTLTRIYRRNSILNARRRGPAPVFIDTAPVWAHVDSLTAEGWGETHIAQTVGCNPGLIHRRNPRMRPALATRILNVTRNDLYRTATDTTLVPSVGAIRRIRALQALGWPLGHIDGLNARNTVARNGLGIMSARGWRQIRDRYNTLAMTEGPSDRTRAWAQRAGWAPPLAWDDDTIDDPAAVAQGAR